MSDEQRVETVARALAEVDYGAALEGMPEGYWHHYQTRARTAIFTLEAAGHVIVPAEPTDAMLTALANADEPQGRYSDAGYRAMIAARPKGGDSE